MHELKNRFVNIPYKMDELAYIYGVNKDTMRTAIDRYNVKKIRKVINGRSYVFFLLNDYQRDEIKKFFNKHYK